MSHTPWPISSPYGPRPSGDGFHDGDDYDTPDAGVVVGMPFDGVLHHRNDPAHYGRYWKAEHAGGVVTRGAHLKKWLAGDGVKLKAGTPIAITGGVQGADGSGNSSGSHIHYEYERDGTKLNPSLHGRRGKLFHSVEEDDDMTPEQDQRLKDIQNRLTAGGGSPIGARVAAVDSRTSQLLNIEVAELKKRLDAIEKKLG